MPEYRELDFINSLLSNEEKRVRDSVRDFVDNEVIPHIKYWYTFGQFPRHIIFRLGELGILGGHLDFDDYVPRFQKISGVAYGLAMQELERADGGLRSFASTQGSLATFPILEYGSEEQKNYWLPLLYGGKKIGCFGLTEEQGGSDPSNMQTRLTKTEGGYLLNGKKTWITNGGIADVGVVWAINDDGKIMGVLVEKDMTGFTTKPVVKNEFKNSMRASVTSSLIFKDCFVPDKNILPKASGMKPLLSTLSKARFGIAWGVIGAAYGCLAEARDFVADRVIFGTTLAEKQLVQNDLAEMRKDIMTMQASILTYGRLAELGKINHIHISVTKFNNVTSALKIAQRADELLGGNRISWEYAIPRHMANLRAVETYEGTRFIHALMQGADITGKKAF